PSCRSVPTIHRRVRTGKCARPRGRNSVERRIETRTDEKRIGRSVATIHERWRRSSMSTGVWLVGARGNIATTAMVGARAIARGETGTDGMVTERAPCDSLDLPSIDSLVFGGHDIRTGSVVETADGLHERNGVPGRDALDAVRDDLAAIDDRIETGTARNCGETVEAL